MLTLSNRSYLLRQVLDAVAILSLVGRCVFQTGAKFAHHSFQLPVTRPRLVQLLGCACVVLVSILRTNDAARPISNTRKWSVHQHFSTFNILSHIITNRQNGLLYRKCQQQGGHLHINKQRPTGSKQPSKFPAWRRFEHFGGKDCDKYTR